MDAPLLRLRRAVTGTVLGTVLCSSAAPPVVAAQTTSAAGTAGSILAPSTTSRLCASWPDSRGTKSTYHLFVTAVTGTRPVGVVVYLDGDGMYGHDHPTSAWALGGSKGIVAVAAARGYATLSIRTSDGVGTPTFWENGSVNARYVDELVRKSSAELGTGKTWLVGYFGGSQLLTKFLITGHPASFGVGGAVIYGGGGAPKAPSASNGARMAGFPMFWYTGTADDGSTSGDGCNALADARRGSAWYLARGFRVTRQEPAGVTHSGLGTRFGSVLAGQLNKTSAQTVPSPAPAR